MLAPFVKSNWQFHVDILISTRFLCFMFVLMLVSRQQFHEWSSFIQKDGQEITQFNVCCSVVPPCICVRHHKRKLRSSLLSWCDAHRSFGNRWPSSLGSGIDPGLVLRTEDNGVRAPNSVFATPCVRNSRFIDGVVVFSDLSSLFDDNSSWFYQLKVLSNIFLIDSM